MSCTCLLYATPDSAEECSHCVNRRAAREILDRCEELYWATADPGEAEGRGEGMDAGDALEAIRLELKKLEHYI